MCIYTHIHTFTHTAYIDTYAFSAGVNMREASVRVTVVMIIKCCIRNSFLWGCNSVTFFLFLNLIPSCMVLL